MDLSSATSSQQQIITTLDAPLSVSAGAGSGKTFTLTNRIGYALVGEAGVSSTFIDSIDEVLATTFSKSGAAEMKSRVRSLLQQEGLDEQALMIEDAWITTIHGLCARILREHALELGIDPGFEIVEKAESEELWYQALDSVLKDISDEGNTPLKRLFDWYPKTKSPFGGESLSMLLTKLWEKTLAMPQGFESVVLPQAGFDHQRSLRRMIEVAQDYERFARSLGEGANKTILNNVDGLQAAIAKAHHYLEQLDSSKTDFSNTQVCLDYLDVLLSFPKLKASSGKVKPDAEVFEYYRSEYAEIAHAAIADASARLSADLLTLTRLVDRVYQQLKGSDRLDNADLLRACNQALEHHPSIAHTYQQRFKLIMVDEFQDTDLLQVSIIDKLSRDHGANVMTVGDAQQTLYRFRGADVEVFFDHRVMHQQAHANLQALSLPDNFRSHGDVLAFVETIFSRPDFFGDRFLALRPQGAVSKDPDPLFEERPRIEVDVIESWSKGGGIDDARRLGAKRIAAHFASLRAEGASPADMAILLGGMTNVALYIEALAEEGFESIISGGSVFASAPEVQLIEALIAVVADKRASSDLYTVLSSPLFNLGDDALFALAHFIAPDDGNGVKLARGASFAQRFWYLAEMLLTEDEEAVLGLMGRFCLSSVQREELLRSLRLMQALCVKASDEGLYQALHSLMKDSGWLYRLQAARSDGQAVAGNIFKALEIVLAWQQQACSIPHLARRFSDFLATSKEKPGVLSTSRSNFVRIMTIHSSKGLEFDHVAVAEPHEGLPKSTKLPMETVGERVIFALEPKLSEDPPNLPGVETKNTDSPKKTYELLKEYLTDHSSEAFSDALDVDGLSSDQISYVLDARIAQGALDDALRLLYVALTRASKSLFLSLTNRGSTKFAYKGVFELLHNVLQWDLTPDKKSFYFDYGGSARARVHHEALVEKPEGTQKQPIEISEFIVPVAHEGVLASREVQSDRDRVVSYSALASNHGKGFSSTSGDEVFEEETSVANDLEGSGAPVAVLDDDEEMFPEDMAALVKQQSATALGSAFHRLAQRVIESRTEVGVVPELPASAFVAQVRLGSLSQLQEKRLDEATQRWFASDLCKRFFACEHIYAEVPFMLEISSSDRPLYLEGEIDGLAVSEADKDHAFFIDYKTGGSDEETSEQLHEKHRLQAQCYALALIRQGFKTVEAHFIRVERTSKSDPAQPQEVTYRFTAEDRATLEKAVLSAYEARKG